MRELRLPLFSKKGKNVKEKLIVILGTTASGKSDLGVALARRFGGEIVSADSRQVYRGMNLGSGKITREEMGGVPHHLLDVRNPGEFFSMADYQELAYAAIDGIIGRGAVPFLVGGTGLYVSAITEGYVLSDQKPDLELREKLETYDTPALYRMLREKDPDTEIDPRNRHRVMRAIEKIAAGDQGPAPRQPRYDTLKIGVHYPRPVLKERIEERLERRLKAGMAEEVRGLLDSGISETFLVKLGLEYKYLTWYVTGKMGYEQMTEELGLAIKRFAKRQMIWFRRDPEIHWIDMEADPEEEAGGLIRSFLEGEEGG